MPGRIHSLPNQGITQDWVSPPEILETLLMQFDLDPCCPGTMPWVTAQTMWSNAEEVSNPVIRQDGLGREWFGRVWLNPPYGRGIETWMRKMRDHGSGVSLIAARTETKWFEDFVWKGAHSVFFFYGRLHYHRPDGARARGNAGHGSAMAAYGDAAAIALREFSLRNSGKYIDLR